MVLTIGVNTLFIQAPQVESKKLGPNARRSKDACLEALGNYSLYNSLKKYLL
jgi:hypothetical protein